MDTKEAGPSDQGQLTCIAKKILPTKGEGVQLPKPGRLVRQTDRQTDRNEQEENKRDQDSKQVHKADKTPTDKVGRQVRTLTEMTRGGNAFPFCCCLWVVGTSLVYA